MNAVLVIIDHLVLPVLVAILGALAPIAIRYLTARLRKLQVDVDSETEAKILAAVDAGIHYAEEQARKAIKSSTSGNTQKLDDATEVIADELKRRKLPELAAETIAQLVESRLGVLRKDPASPVVDNNPAVPKENP